MSQWIDRDRAVVWHPFTNLLPEPELLMITHGKGPWLYDDQSKRYLDLVSSWWVNIHGHAHPFIAEAIARQAQSLEQVLFAGCTHQPAVELAEMLIQLWKGHFSRVFYSDNGSTAVEVAVKMAIQYWKNLGIQKPVFLALENGYHGDTFGAMSVSGQSVYNQPFEDRLFEVKYIPVPTIDQSQQALQALQHWADQGTVAGFIYEPLIQGASGMLMHHPEHLEPLLSYARSKNILLIADEVMTGFSRTGKMWASEWMATLPDIVCLSKGITGGFLPLGATIMRQHIVDAFWTDQKSKGFYHGHSYTANPLACAAAIASLQLFREDQICMNIQWIRQFYEQLTPKISRFPKVKNLRSRGTILAFELTHPEGDHYFNSLRDPITRLAMEHSLLLRPLGNTIYLMPPYCLGEEEGALMEAGLLRILERWGV